MQVTSKSAVAPDSRVLWRAFLALTFVAATAVCAQVSFRLWFSPVPVTLQVLAVILSGLVLGSRWGAISQIQYLAMGAMGLPVFAGGGAGPAAFVGPTGGYLIGFVAGAFLAGLVFERLRVRPSIAAWCGGIAGIVGVHLFGVAWLSVWMSFAGEKSCILRALQLGSAPFIGIDLVKVAIASGLVRSCRRLSDGVME